MMVEAEAAEAADVLHHAVAAVTAGAGIVHAEIVKAEEEIAVDAMAVARRAAVVAMTMIESRGAKGIFNPSPVI